MFYYFVSFFYEKFRSGGKGCFILLFHLFMKNCF